jgi:hypothetical protein
MYSGLPPLPPPPAVVDDGGIRNYQVRGNGEMTPFFSLKNLRDSVGIRLLPLRMLLLLLMVRLQQRIKTSMEAFLRQHRKFPLVVCSLMLMKKNS